MFQLLLNISFNEDNNAPVYIIKLSPLIFGHDTFEKNFIQRESVDTKGITCIILPINN